MKVYDISEEAVETCFMLNDHVCRTALDGDCPRSTCKEAYEKMAEGILAKVKAEASK